MGRKVLILANLDIGLYKFRKELIFELQKQGNEIYLSLPYGKLVDKFIEAGCHFTDTPIDRRGINPIRDGKLFLKYIHMIKQVKPDLVITYTIKPNVYGALAARLLNVKYAVNITGLGTAFQSESFVKKIVVWMYRMSCKKAQVVFFENEENERVFLGNRIVKESQTCRLHGAGVNLLEYPFTQYPQEDRTIRFLFVGRVMKEKGVDELFHAFETAKLKYPFAELDIVGPYEDNYKEIVEKLVQKGIIRYHGYQEDVRPYLANCHCFVLPSYHEGMANTLLEAGAMGRPLITSDIPGCREAVTDEKNGFLVREKDSEQLREKLETFICISYERKKKMGESSYKNIARIFNKEMVVKETIRFLN